MPTAAHRLHCYRAGSPDTSPVVLVHGLMGRGTTWRAHLPWFASRLPEGAGIYVYDQPYHTGGPFPPSLPAAEVAGQTRRLRADDPDPAVANPDVSTEFFTRALTAAVTRVLAETGAPDVILVGHSMGSMHAWCVAATHPELVRGVVVEDMSPDFRGLTTILYDAYFDSWPVTFTEPDFARLFGDIAGPYFRHSFDKHTDPDGTTRWTLHGYMETFKDIANYWGDHAAWDEWDAVRCPVLLLKARDGVTQGRTMETMAERNPQAFGVYYARHPGHVIHDVDTEFYQRHVGDFLNRLTAKNPQGI